MLLLMHRRLWLRMSCLRRELRRLRMVGTRSHMVCLGGWGHAATDRARARRWRAGRTLRARTAGGRTRRLCVGPGCFLAWTSWPLRSMLGGGANALALLVWVQLLRW